MMNSCYSPNMTPHYEYYMFCLFATQNAESSPPKWDVSIISWMCICGCDGIFFFLTCMFACILICVKACLSFGWQVKKTTWTWGKQRFFIRSTSIWFHPPFPMCKSMCQREVGGVGTASALQMLSHSCLETRTKKKPTWWIRWHPRCCAFCTMQCFIVCRLCLHSGLCCVWTQQFVDNCQENL